MPISCLAGVEVSSRDFEFEFDIAGRLSDNWSIIDAYSDIDAAVPEDPTVRRKQLSNVARHTASAFLT